MTFNKFVNVLAVLFCLVVMTGCASITRGTSDALVVTSEPDQATVKIYRTNGGFNRKEIKNNQVEDENNPSAGPVLGATPASFKLSRKGEYKVEISKEGYKTVQVNVGNRISGAGGAGMAGNILIGGLIGVGVDAATGAAKDLTPNPIDVTLESGSGLVVLNAIEKQEEPEQDPKTDEPLTPGSEPEQQDLILEEQPPQDLEGQVESVADDAKENAENN